MIGWLTPLAWSTYPLSKTQNCNSATFQSRLFLLFGCIKATGSGLRLAQKCSLKMSLGNELYLAKTWLLKQFCYQSLIRDKWPLLGNGLALAWLNLTRLKPNLWLKWTKLRLPHWACVISECPSSDFGFLGAKIEPKLNFNFYDQNHSWPVYRRKAHWPRQANTYYNVAGSNTSIKCSFCA